MAQQQWYIINNVSELDTPALVVYPDRVQHNIDLVKTMIDNADRLRPHVKTHKSGDVTALMLQAGINKFKCATIAEAEMLGMAQAPDVLLAYQPVGPKINRFIELVKAYPLTAYSCLVDSVDTAKAIADKAVERNLQVSVYIDLNIGMNRTGIIPQKAFELYGALASTRSITIKGLHAYDGHIHDADYNVRVQRAEEAIAPVFELAAAIKAKGYPEPVIIGGSSPTLPILVNKKNIQVSPGTFAYWDRGYQQAYPEQEFLTAALVVARVISLPGETKICIDLGHKSVAAENKLSKRVYFLNAPDLVFTGQSEEHLVAEAGAGHSFKAGDILYGLPYHVCPTVAVYESAITIKEGFVNGEWKTPARDRKITI
jgi:D-serine deaminase-like pyridoxal phosphate-dependent protein